MLNKITFLYTPQMSKKINFSTFTVLLRDREFPTQALNSKGGTFFVIFHGLSKYSYATNLGIGLYSTCSYEYRKSLNTSRALNATRALNTGRGLTELSRASIQRLTVFVF